VAQELNWKPEIYDLKCMEWSEMEDDLMAGGTFGNGTCDMAVAGYSAIPVSQRQHITIILLSSHQYRGYILLIAAIFSLSFTYCMSDRSLFCGSLVGAC